MDIVMDVKEPDDGVDNVFNVMATEGAAESRSPSVSMATATSGGQTAVSSSPPLDGELKEEEEESMVGGGLSFFDGKVAEDDAAAVVAVAVSSNGSSLAMDIPDVPAPPDAETGQASNGANSATSAAGAGAWHGESRLDASSSSHGGGGAFGRGGVDGGSASLSLPLLRGTPTGMAVPAVLGGLKPGEGEQPIISHSTPGTRPSFRQWTFEEQFRQLYELSADADRKEFLDSLFTFMNKRGTPVSRIPIMAKVTLDLYKLFVEVVNRGGLIEVINKKMWRDVANALDIPTSITSAAFTLRTQYIKYLYPYECETKRLSDPEDLQLLMENSRRDGRTSSASTPQTPNTPVRLYTMDPAALAMANLQQTLTACEPLAKRPVTPTPSSVPFGISSFCNMRIQQACTDSSGNVTEIPTDCAGVEVNSLSVSMEINGLLFQGVLYPRSASTAAMATNPPSTATDTMTTPGMLGVPPLTALPLAGGCGGVGTPTTTTTAVAMAAMMGGQILPGPSSPATAAIIQQQQHPGHVSAYTSSQPPITIPAGQPQEQDGSESASTSAATATTS